MNFANLKKGFNRKDRKKEKYDVQVRNALSDQSLIYSYGKILYLRYKNKAGCVFPMVISSEFRMGKY